MGVTISVVIPTYNPKKNYLQRVLDALYRQTLNVEAWECIIVDNASTTATLASIDTKPFKNLRIVREEKPGLTYARIRGFEESIGEILIFVDDDNVLSGDYLENCMRLFNEYPALGVAGGRSPGEFEVTPPVWANPFFSLIAVRPDAAPQTITDDLSKGYPVMAPIGAGMAIRRSCFEAYRKYIFSLKEVTTDRTGNGLSSGGDNEINIIALKEAFHVGFFPELALTHLIDKERLEVDYLKRMNFAATQSWVILLSRHGLCPWKPIDKNTLLLRQIKVFFKYRPWKSPSNAILYKGALGMLKGQSEIKQQ